MQYEVVRKASRAAGRKETREIGYGKSPPSRDAGVKANFLVNRHGTPEAALGFANERLLHHIEGTDTHHYWKAVAAVLKRYCTGKKDGDHRRGRGELKIDSRDAFFKVPQFVKQGLGPRLPELNDVIRSERH